MAVNARPVTGARTGVEVGDWQEAIRTACQPLVDDGAVEPRYPERCIAMVEEHGPYIVLAPGIALAHARPEDGVRAMGVSAVTLRTPVAFGHPDNDPVDLVFAFGSPDREQHVGLLSALARRMLEVVREDRLIHVAGTGHSLALVLEAFYRAGGLACVRPLFHPALLPLAGGAASTLLERTSGLGALLLEQATPEPGDLAFVFSNSGINPVPMELAQGLRKAGTEVVAVVSVPHMTHAPARAGVRLADVADEVRDTQVPPGDVSYPPAAPVTAALSSLTSVYLWNLLLARLADLAAARGAELPLWSSANMEGGTERNADLAQRYRSRIPFL